MNQGRLAAFLFLFAGTVFLMLAFTTGSPNNLHLILGVAFVALGAANLRSSRRG